MTLPQGLITGKTARLPKLPETWGQLRPVECRAAINAAWSGRTLTIVVPGTPVGKPRMTQRDKWAKRPAVLKYRAWADAARAAAGALPPVETIQALSWLAIFEPPQSWSKKKRMAAIGELHRSKPDRDNIDKAVLDSLFQQDSGIAKGTIEKRWGVTAELIIEITISGATQ